MIALYCIFNFFYIFYFFSVQLLVTDVIPDVLYNVGL